MGTGSVAFAIEYDTSSSSGTSQDISVDFATMADLGGVTFGQSIGFHYGYTYTVDTSKSYNFSGQVGDLPDATHSYKFGFMVHKGMLPGTGTTYPAFLVDYWVEGLQ